MNKKAYVETILNNGAVAAEGMVPAKFAKVLMATTSVKKMEI